MDIAFISDHGLREMRLKATCKLADFLILLGRKLDYVSSQMIMGR